jgi:iron complex outermembrane receptor protein
MHSDTIRIDDVNINRKPVYYNNTTGYKKAAIDSAVMMNYSHETIAEILSENSNIFIKSYGMGGIATVSLRGTGAGHTKVEWNGISLNNPMLGQSDLSSLPTGMIDGLDLYYGGASMSMGSGGIGGIINLLTGTNWKKETRIDFNPGIGSFERYTGLFSVRTGNINFQTVTKLFYQSAENDFRFLNQETYAQPAWETRTNSQVKHQGIIQELYYRGSRHTLSAKLWYQASDRNLPSSMLTNQTGLTEKQFDESIRTIVNFEFRGYSGNYFVTGALITNRLDYSNTLASIDSRNLSDMLTFKTGMERNIMNGTCFKLVLEDEFNRVKTNNYENRSGRNTSTITASAEHNKGGLVGASFLLRETVDRNKFLIPDFSAGLQLRIPYSDDQLFKLNISRNSKIPTMNDLFWVPGGNPDLKNEYAVMYEFSYVIDHKFIAPLKIKSEVTIYRNSIKDMIQWRPGIYSFWTADNISNVNTMGLESTILLEYRINKITASLKGAYSYTRAVNAGSDNYSGKQLMYVPEHQANAGFQLSFRNLYSSWITNLTGKRYISVNNSDFLSGYSISSVSAGIKLKLQKNLLDINIKADNIFNADYQTIAHYPLPLRSYSLKLLLQIVL